MKLKDVITLITRLHRSHPPPGTQVSALERHGVDSSTLTFVTSDNGPWLAQGQHGGSSGPFRGGKFTLQEGGIRVFGKLSRCGTG